MKIIDNFLPEYQFKQIKSTLESPGVLPWYYNDAVVYPEEDGYNPKDYQFTHTFFDLKPPWNGIGSTYYDNLSFCLQKLGVNKLMRCKANLTPSTLFHRKSGYHIDVPNVTTAVYYTNTNNGWTQFKKGGKVKSVSNRMVIFDSNLEHQGVTCTDQKIRVVLNFNYV